MYVQHHILDAMNFYKNPFLVNFYLGNFEFIVKGFSCIFTLTCILSANRFGQALVIYDPKHE